MEKDFKEAVEKSTKAIKELEGKIEDIAEDLSENASQLWSDFKKNFADMSSKLDGASENISKAGEETSLQAHLGAMEARDKMEDIKKGVEEFATKISKDAQTTLDTATLQAHLGKMEAEDFWEKKGKSITEEFNLSKESVEKSAVEAINEIGNFFEKLSTHFSEKKSTV
jgi:hypothetical protein